MNFKYLLLALVFTLLNNSQSFATPDYQTAFFDEYFAGLPSGQQKDVCFMCHSKASTPIDRTTLNVYGRALLKARGDFYKIENIDSDRDGTSNLEEIKSGNFPGSMSSDLDIFVLKNPRGNVVFNHKAHITEPSYNTQGDCKKCHGGYPGFEKFYNPNKVDSYSGHWVCKECHLNHRGQANPPIHCNGCHKRER